MKRFLLAALLALAPTIALAADNLSPADLKKLHDYTLSMDKIMAMQAVMNDIKGAHDPSLQKQASAIGDSSQSLGEMEAKLKGNAKLWAFYAKHGLSPDDAVVMPFVIMSAGVAAQYPQAAGKLADQTLPAQIAFFKAHQAELNKLSWINPPDNDQ